MPQLCLVLPTPVEVVVTLVVTEIFDEVPFFCCVARMASSISIRSRTSATVAPFIQGAFQGQMLGVEFAADATDLWGPLAPIQQGYTL